MHRTINPSDLRYFWSCGGSPTPEAEENLDYKFPVKTQEQLLKGSQEVMELQGVAIISSFCIKVFDPSDMQSVDFKYAPTGVQLQVGMTPG